MRHHETVIGEGQNDADVPLFTGDDVDWGDVKKQTRAQQKERFQGEVSIATGKSPVVVHAMVKNQSL